MDMETRHSPRRATEAGRLISVIESVPEEKRPTVAMMVEAFINGMEAQERLAAERSGT